MKKTLYTTIFFLLIIINAYSQSCFSDDITSSTQTITGQSTAIDTAIVIDINGYTAEETVTEYIFPTNTLRELLNNTSNNRGGERSITVSTTETYIATNLNPSGVFIDGPGGDVDTGIDVLMSSGWPTRNGGQHPEFQLDGAPGDVQRALIKFDLSSLPDSYICTSATLYLYHSYDPEATGLNTGKVYSISAANWPWIEGTGNIDIAKQGEPCWNAREADGSEGVQTAWAGSEGCSTIGVDYESTQMGEWSYNGNQPKGYEIVIPLDASRVQAWFGNSNTNYGIILVTDDNTTHAHVGSDENTFSGYRPKLVVHYQ